MAVAIRPLMTATIESRMRENAKAKTTSNKAVRKSILLLVKVAVAPSVPAETFKTLSTMYCCNFGGTNSAATPATVSRHRKMALRRYGRSRSETRRRICPRCMHLGQASSEVVSRNEQLRQRGTSQFASIGVVGNPGDDESRSLRMLSKRRQIL